MATISNLWLPILLSAVFVFILSSIIHMMLPWHKGDYRKLPDEDGVMEALRRFSLPPGDYLVPRPSSAAGMKEPAYIEKRTKGPVVVMTVFPSGIQGMASNLIQWFLFCIVVSVFAGYIAGRAVPPGSEYLRVFRFAGTTAFAGYSLALMQQSIWYRRNWGATFRSMIDGLIYACFTAGTFGWLWPKS